MNYHHSVPVPFPYPHPALELSNQHTKTPMSYSFQQRYTGKAISSAKPRLYEDGLTIGRLVNSAENMEVSVLSFTSGNYHSFSVNTNLHKGLVLPSLTVYPSQLT